MPATMILALFVPPVLAGCPPVQGECFTTSAGNPNCDMTTTSDSDPSEGSTETSGETTSSSSETVSTTVGPVCGDGSVDAGEECDDGNDDNTDQCTNTCTIAACGDGFVQPSNGETCDDGNLVSGDGCDDQCVLENCGDGVVDPGEECDDGNGTNGDGCETDCQFTLGAAQIVAGDLHTCARFFDGSVVCWGNGEDGQLGYGNTDTVGDTPGTIPLLLGAVQVGGKVVQLTAGSAHTCALLDNGDVRCWGDNTFGQIGYPQIDAIGDDETPAEFGESVFLGDPALSISAGTFHTCAVLDDNDVYCWGRGESGRLGYGNEVNIGDNESPVSAGAVPIGAPSEQVACGGSHTCAIDTGGEVRCWGLGAFGQLGYGDTDTVGDGGVLIPVKGVVDIGPTTATQITLGENHTCARLNIGALLCWGLGNFGQLGYGTTQNIGDDELPFDAGFIELDNAASDIDAGGFHTCAIALDGSARCWGLGLSGQLGYGDIENLGDNEDVGMLGDVDIGATVTSFGLGLNHTCAQTDTNQVRCWGDASDGQLGYGDTQQFGHDPDFLPWSAGDVPLF